MYRAFYKLSEKPFTRLPDPGFLYMSEKHRMAATLLEYGLMNQAGFTVISGDIGAGKTTLIRHLLDNMDRDHTVGLISNTHHSFGELLQWILLAFNLEHAGMTKVEMYQRFVDFIIDEYAHNRSTVLIVDEAQNMSAETLEELRMLSNVNADKDQALQVILVGQNELRDTLRRPDLVQFAQRISVDYHLQPLSEDETAHYIRHRLKVAGGRPDIFTD
jgi:general secretion pathway protein A